jgi:DNA helicase-2/ATP-dependent DNA helicase PcrA
MKERLTEEQERIIHHPLGYHARVLAVAGSGKTTTMVHRVSHLVLDLNQDPKRIRIVMFNRLAREDFEQKLAEQIPDLGKRPPVLTFHGLAYRMYQDAQKRGLLPPMELWAEEKEELALISMRQAIESLIRDGLLTDDVDPSEAMEAVSLWKAALIPPERAGHRTNPDLPLVYRRFEEFRRQAGALTFDDFVPEALNLMDRYPDFRKRWTNQLDHLIVDEYQDINYGQQQLIRLLAGDRADVMVVGDDDQTIYEWRGARPDYILQRFKEDFANKPTIDYTLSHSFRFGPLLAQSAYNVIVLNQRRETKPLAAHNLQMNTGITVLTWQDRDRAAREMAQEIISLVRDHHVPPHRIGVLGRTYAQLGNLQAVFIEAKIPFRVVVDVPFFERDENRTLVDYIRVAQHLDQPPSAMKPWGAARPVEEEEDPVQARSPLRYRFRPRRSPCGEAVRAVLAVANTPSRMLLRSALQNAVEKGHNRGWSLGQSLEALLDPYESPLPAERRENMQALIDLLARIRERILQEPDLKAGDLLNWIVEHTRYLEHFSHYYGEGLESSLRVESVLNFIHFAARTELNVPDFVRRLGTLDTTRGLPSEQVIPVTTVHRTKGLEYEYVFIPDCIEGCMPVHIADDCAVYDTEGIVPDFPPSPPLESERRLFYVAITRAVRHLYIGTIQGSGTDQPSRFLEEMRVDATRPILEALRPVLESGAVDGRQLAALKSQLASSPDHLLVLRSIIRHYLSGDLAEQWLKELPEAMDSSFKYSRDYPPLETVREQVQRQQPRWEPVADPWEGIGITL